MSVGIFIDGRRPKSKKEVREVVATGELGRIELENTSAFDNKFDCSLATYVDRAKAGEGGIKLRVDFVGPDPYTKRNFYGNIVIATGAQVGKVTVK